MLMIKTFDNLSKCTLANNLNELESVGNMIIFLHSVVSFFVIETIVD